MRFVMILVFFLGCLQSVALLTSATIARNADQYLASGGSLNHMQQQIEFAARLDPMNLRLLDLRIETEQDPLKRRELIQEMLELEPVRAEGWLRLYTHKLMQSEFDEELLATMRSLAALAPYEPHVQEALIREGLNHWFEIGSVARRLLLDTAVRAVESHASYRQTQRLELVTNGGLMPLVCALSRDLEQCQGLRK